jgi:hypothetical protein
MLTEDHNPLAHRRALLTTCVDRTLMTMGVVEPMDRLRPRMYDPTVGRFVSFDAFEADPGEPTHLHKYSYANANPVAYVDPSGHMGVADTLGVITVRTKILVGMLAAAGIGAIFRYFVFPPEKARGAGVNCMQYATGIALEANLNAAYQQGIISGADLRRYTNDPNSQNFYTDMYNNPEKYKQVLTATFGAPPVEADADPHGKRKIAAFIYFHQANQEYDYHIISQHRDGHWSGKHGITDEIQTTSPAKEQRGLFGKKLVGFWIIDKPPLD